MGTWLPQYDQGKTPADYAAAAGMAVHGVGHLPAQRNALADAFRALPATIQAYLKDKRNKEIAAQLQAQDQPDAAMDDLQYQKAYRQTYPEQFPDSQANGKYPVQLPDGTTVNVTGNKAAELYMKQFRPNAAEQKARHFSESAPATSAADINRMPPSDTDIDPAQLYQRAVQQPKVMGQQTDAAPSDPDAVLNDARDAIKRGKDPEAVKKRLQEMGIDPTGL